MTCSSFLRWLRCVQTVVCAGIVFAQAPPAAILRVDIENWVPYYYDTFDLTKLATDPNPTAAAAARNFRTLIAIGDIVAVNGRPAKGTLTTRLSHIFLSPTPTPGQAVADTLRQALNDSYIEILQSDGTPVGSFFTYGLTAGSNPPGAPLAVTTFNLAVIGGTGAYLGVRGQSGVRPFMAAPRPASVTEDPSRRRINRGGLDLQTVLHLIPMSHPEIVRTADGPAVYHTTDFSQVTSARPARAGELLMLMAGGLGPVRPGVDPGQPFPDSPLMEVNSPVDVTVNGVSAEVVNKVGWPGRTGVYRLDILVPEGTARGTAAVQISSAWIRGTEFALPIQ